MVADTNMDFIPGDRVKMWDDLGHRWATGEITIVKERVCKVMFDADFDFAYEYYPKFDLQVIERKEHVE